MFKGLREFHITNVKNILGPIYIFADIKGTGPG